jgi:hypothetical protein
MTAAKTGAKRDFGPKIVHAYRREPHRNADGKELPVEVIAAGEKIKFHSNEAGHIVGTVLTQGAYERLTKEIPEAYIPYQDGENIPERRAPAEDDGKPAGKWVLSNGKAFVVLDTMSDAEVRDFAKAADLDIHASLDGDALRQSVFNMCQTG